MLFENKLSGVGTALVTPFTPQGEVNYDALKKILEHSLEGGVDFLVAMGTTGESPTLHPEEKRKICRRIVEWTAGRVPLVMGLGSNSTEAVLRAFAETDFEGYSYILSVAPYYNKPSQAGLFAHYKAIAEASPLPIIIYNIPSRCGVNVEPETIVRLAREVPRIAGVKEASGDVINIGRILKDRPEGFSVLSGDDSLTMAVMAMGGEGVISTTANLLPREMVALTRAMYKGDSAQARELHNDMAAVIKMLFEQGNPAGVKAALHIKGFCENILRLPLVPVSEELYERLETALK